MAICRAQYHGYGSFSRSLLGASVLLAFAAAPALGAPAHVADAESLLTNLTSSRQNVYGSSPSYIYWTGSSSKARTVCGTFITNLLEHSYGWTASTFTSWMGTTSPNATVWHDTIEAQDNFTKIDDISQVAPGDIIAIRYPSGSSVSGHAMMVAAVPRVQHTAAKGGSGTTQYAVTVIDSSSDHHGSNDTRVTNPSSTGNGIGRGDISVYVNSSLQPVGYAWSTDSGSPFYSTSARPLAIGRLSSGHLNVNNAALPAPGSTGNTTVGGGMPEPGGQAGQPGEVTWVFENNPPGQSDDDTAAGAGNSVSGDSVAAPQAGGCTFAPGALAGAAVPASLLSLMVLLGLRRRVRASQGRPTGKL